MDALNQAKTLVQKSQNILILPPADLQGDSLGSSLALFYTLKKLGKNVNTLIEKVPEKFQFLTSLPSQIPPFHERAGLGEQGENFVILINTEGKEIEKMHYEKNERDLKIYLTLSRGGIKEKDVSFAGGDKTCATNEKADLLVTLGVARLEDLGKHFEENPKLFYEVPILNIDNHPANENFGEVNLIEIKSCSVSEIVTNLIKSMDDSLVDENIATHLLTGVISASQNFQNSGTCPKTLETASCLIEGGANHQKIIQHLYKTKDISQIRLLGRILEKLNFDEKKELYSASLTGEDFQTSGASSKDLGPVIEELKFNFWKIPTLLILWESHSSAPIIKGVFYSVKSDLVEKILENFESVSRGEGVLFLIRDLNLSLAKEKVLKTLSENIKHET